ncbi:MAG: hypothetical protein M1511_12600 [Deltaproteobacteria bacterium]|nr:hypothetical protein [Deltaproteobacteria bacterium]
MTQKTTKTDQQKLPIIPLENEDSKLQKYHGFELRTKSNLPLDQVVSGLQKAIRRGLEDRALYFMHEMIESGFIKYFWRRISVICIEDVGLANPNAPILVNSLAQMNERLNHRKEIRDTYCPGMAVLYLCRAPKSREVDYALDWVDLKRKEGVVIEPEDFDLDCHTDLGRQRLKEKAKIAGKTYDELVDEKFYFEGILANTPVSVNDDVWKKKVWELRKLDKSRISLKYTESE